MAELKPCPFCGSSKLKMESKSKNVGWTGIDARVDWETYSVRCNSCHARGGTAGGKVIQSHLYIYRDNMPHWAITKEELQQKAIDSWNRRTSKIVKVETNFFDKEETFPNCTVQVLTNTATGETSVGWWRNAD
jgi:Lar family restriction alleviation protein